MGHQGMKQILKEVHSVEDVVNASRQWCHARNLPVEHQAPSNIQGLYWLDLPLSHFEDPLACLSNGMWYPDQRLLRVWTGTSFLWLNTKNGRSYARERFRFQEHYDFYFKDGTYSSAEVHASGMGVGYLPTLLFDKTSTFELLEVEKGGMKWERPSRIFLGQYAFTYEMFKVLDEHGNIIEENNEKFVAALNKAPKTKSGIMHYFWDAKMKGGNGSAPAKES